MSEEKTGTIELAKRVARSKEAFDALEHKIKSSGDKYNLRIADSSNSYIEIPSAFSVPAMRALQAILAQAMKLDAADLAERTGLPMPKLEPEDQEVRVRMVQLALTEGDADEDA